MVCPGGHGNRRGGLMGRLDGKVALVTGGGSGIGRHTSVRFAEEGARVAVADLKGDTAEATAAEIRAAGGDATACTMDVTRSADVAAGVQAAIEAFGGVDVVVNNAGITITGAAHDLTEDDWDRELAINLKSVYLTSPRRCGRTSSSAAAARSCRPRRSPGCGRSPTTRPTARPRPGSSCSRSASRSTARRRASARTACARASSRPPMIDGYFSDQADPAASRDFAVGLHPLGRLGDPLDIADGFVYLASDQARWVTGTALTVDGGLTAGIWGG